ncbi:MAG: HD family phosphohydrolase [bacterium]
MSKIAEIVSHIQKVYREGLEALQGHRYWPYTPQLLMALVIIATTTFMFPQTQEYQFVDLKEGDVYTGKEVIAPFTFFVNKSDDEYERDKRLAAEGVPPVFVRVDSVDHEALEKLDELIQEITKIRTSVFPDSVKIRRFREILNEFKVPPIEQENITFLLSNNKESKTNSGPKKQSNNEDVRSQTEGGKLSKFEFRTFISNLRRILTDIYTIGVLNLSPNDIPAHVVKISVISQNAEFLEDLNNFYTHEDIDRILRDKLQQAYPQQNRVFKLGYLIVRTFLQPNLIYDDDETETRIQVAQSKVPLAKGTVLENERIINTHEIITKETLEKLKSLALEKAERELRAGGIKLILPYIGRVLIVSLSLSFVGMFLLVARKEIFSNVKNMLLIFVIFMVILFITFLSNQFEFSKYLIPIAIASMLLTIFFDTRTAFIGTVALSVLIGALRGNEFGIMIISLFVGTISTFAVREIEARSWMLKGILAITGAYVLSIGTLESIRNTAIMDILKDWGYGGLNGLFSPIMTYGLMIIFEYIFKMTTNSTFLELSDLNKPLLRELAIRAPGTYHHSIMVGNLSEIAAEAIGANALLARVGAYYHDIGKMDISEYFVENQKAGKNPHEKLTPNMSCLILINHVKKGLEIAEQYNLPKEIRDFIPEHHGTNLISYFYKKALEANDGTDVNEANFRYPGPKPQTKETGIVMLADGVEAVSRTLQDPTVSRIRSMVNTIIQERLSDLDECPLTLRDLNLIKEGFVTHLTGIFHGRIEYPQQEKRFFRRRRKKPIEKALETSGPSS